MDKVFYVDLVSNASMDIHPENKLSSFTNIMASPIELDEPYEVALNEIIYPLDFNQTIEIEYCFVYIQKSPFKKDWLSDRIKFKFDGTWKLTQILEKFSIQSGKDLSEALAAKKLTLDSKPTLEYDEAQERVFLSIGELSNGQLLVLYFYGEEFLGPLGFERQLYIDFYNKANAGEKHYAGYPPYLTARSNLLFINTDIIEGHRVGDVVSNNLRTIPLSKGPYESVQYMSFPNQYFFPVRFSRIDRIAIRIMDENGEPIRFRGGRVFITLKFKPKGI